MIQVAQVDADTDGSGGDTHGCCLTKPCQLLVFHSLNQESDNHEEDDEQIIIGHLHMIGLHLKGGKQGRQDESPEIFSPITKHNTSNHWWQIGQGHHFPNVSGSNDNEEITGESPDDRTQNSQLLAEIKSTQQDVEAQQIGKHIPHIFGQPQVVSVHHLAQCVGTFVRRSRLIGGHTSEH